MASIHPDACIGAVSLVVADLEGAVAFYRDRLGFAVLERPDGSAHLGVGGLKLLELVGSPGALPAPHSTGLFHFAVLLPSRPLLASALRHLLSQGARLDGASDHLVSEALYLRDPEGNGIEIYRDREREEWPREGSRIAMATDPLDVEDLLGEPADARGTWTMPEGTVIGHVHLRVADIAASEAFYCDVLGFDLVTRYGPRASFVSAGGYHHHVGFNTWGGVGAPPPPAGSAGLFHFELRLPDTVARDAVLARVRDAGLDVRDGPHGPLVRDPSGNAAVITTA